MAAILSPYSTVGFYKAPVSKSLLGTMFISSFSLNVPQLAPLKRHFLCSATDVIDNFEIWKFFSCRSTFLDIKVLICGSLLLYYFRVFEKRLGSHKFASFLLATGTITLLLELFVLATLQYIDKEVLSGTLLSSGPYWILFPLFVNYFCDIPRVAHTHILGVPITGKTLTYLLGLQMASSSISSAISGSCGIIAGLIWRYDVLRIQKWFRVPKVLAKMLDATIGRIISSSPPQEGILPMGATLEIQRLQQLEVLEQQMLLNRSREARYYGQNRYHMMQNALNHNNFMDFGNNIRRRHQGGDYSDDSDDSNVGYENQNLEPGTSFSESQVQALVEMGFDRQKVLEALRNTGNDMNLATTLLLQES